MSSSGAQVSGALRARLDGWRRCAPSLFAPFLLIARQHGNLCLDKPVIARGRLKMRWIISAFALIAMGAYLAQAAPCQGRLAADGAPLEMALVGNDRTAAQELTRNCARRGMLASDTSTIAGREQRTIERESEFADSLAGGPDFWEVTGVGPNSRLSLRKEASPHAKRLTNFSNGAMLKNLGCKIGRGQRWCEVERPDDPSVRGWVKGRYLRETAGPK